MAKLLSMANFAYNNTKNVNTSYISFKLNYGYYSHISYEIVINLRFKSKLVNYLLAKLQKLIIVCQKILYYTQKLQKQAQNKDVKLRSYVIGDKFWLNNKYINSKYN